MSSSGKRPAHSDFSASRDNGYGGANCGNGINVGTGTQGLFTVPIKMSSAELKIGPINVERAKKLETRMADKDVDNMLEYHLASCVAIMVSIHCDASGRQWMPVEQLHAELTGKFTAIWPYGNAQQYLAPEDGSSTRTAERPWHRLLELLKNHPERFIMSSISRGTITLEFVSLVSLADKFCCPEVDQVTASSL
nr:FHA domain-containing protein FHA2-like [Aegilops tauschii subsp. strangulata]